MFLRLGTNFAIRYSEMCHSQFGQPSTGSLCGNWYARLDADSGSESNVVKASKLNSAVASGQSSGLYWAGSSDNPIGDFGGGYDNTDAIINPIMGNVSTTATCVQASQKGPGDPDLPAGEEHGYPITRDHHLSQARTARETPIALAANAAYEFASFDYEVTSGHTNGIFDAGWWNDASVMEGSD
jgi:hypothetical protein